MVLDASLVIQSKVVMLVNNIYKHKYRKKQVHHKESYNKLFFKKSYLKNSRNLENKKTWMNVKQ